MFKKQNPWLKCYSLHTTAVLPLWHHDGLPVLKQNNCISQFACLNHLRTCSSVIQYICNHEGISPWLHLQKQTSAALKLHFHFILEYFTAVLFTIWLFFYFFRWCKTQSKKVSENLNRKINCKSHEICFFIALLVFYIQYILYMQGFTVWLWEDVERCSAEML